MNKPSPVSAAPPFLYRKRCHSKENQAPRNVGHILNLVTLLLASLWLFGATASHAETAQQAMPVTVVPLETLLFHPAREAPATVVSLNDSLISVEIAGKVEEMTRRPGDEVEEGDLLARLDCSTYIIARERAAAALEAAKARFKYARQRFKDAEKLVKARNISSDEFNPMSLT